MLQWACAEGGLAAKRALWSRLGRELSSMRAWGPVLAPGVATEKIAQHSRTQVSDRDAANRGCVLSAEGLGAGMACALT
jgi:hypothetical protein